METSDIYFVTSSREFLQRRMWHDYMCVSISQRRAWLYSRRVRWSEPGWWRYWRWSHAAWTATGRVSWGTNFSDQNRLSTHKFHRYYYTQTSGLAKGRWEEKKEADRFCFTLCCDMRLFWHFSSKHRLNKEGRRCNMDPGWECRSFTLSFSLISRYMKSSTWNVRALSLPPALSWQNVRCCLYTACRYIQSYKSTFTAVTS